MAIFKKNLKDAPLFSAGDATHLREIMHPLKDKVDIGYSVAHAFVKPGEASLPHTLDSSETYYILSGKGQMTIGETAFDVAPGMIYCVPAGEVQHIQNTSTVDLMFLCIVEPFWQEKEETVL